jgi:hypothetical protein
MVGYFSLLLVVIGCNNQAPISQPIKRQPITGKVVTTIKCEGITSRSFLALNGVTVRYKADITETGDIKASAEVAIQYDYSRENKQEYYRNEAGSSLSRVTVDADVYAPNNNGGKWIIMLDRKTNLMRARYIDKVTGVIHEVFNFTPANCNTIRG